MFLFEQAIMAAALLALEKQTTSAVAVRRDLIIFGSVCWSGILAGAVVRR
jgi:hypothetical protein